MSARIGQAFARAPVRCTPAVAFRLDAALTAAPGRVDEAHRPARVGREVDDVVRLSEAKPHGDVPRFRVEGHRVVRRLRYGSGRTTDPKRDAEKECGK